MSTGVLPSGLVPLARRIPAISVRTEASRVGDFEPVYALLVGAKADVSEAIKLAYREILTREPSAEEVAEGKEIIAAAASPREGMADLRWLLFNCHEFRFLP